MNPHLSAPFLAVLTVVLTGCSVLRPAEDPTRHFLLKGVRTSRLASNSGLAVLVGPVTVPGYLDHKQIVTAGSQHDLELAEFHVWAEDLDTAVSRVVAENLAHLLGSPAIAPYPAVDPPEHDFKSAIVIRRFEKSADGLVHLDASYIITGSLGSTIKPRTSSRSISVRVADPQSYSSIADAMSRALSDLSRSISRGILSQDHNRRQAAKLERAKSISPDPRD